MSLRCQQKVHRMCTRPLHELEARLATWLSLKRKYWLLRMSPWNQFSNTGMLIRLTIWASHRDYTRNRGLQLRHGRESEWIAKTVVLLGIEKTQNQRYSKKSGTIRTTPAFYCPGHHSFV
ncbi:hypothetical protein O6H91_01G040300 [Diphasiastrum complanatum]|uniref:Uncharacterized protein n=1 Tax=Diphasiastrum complanatum TaxID=34168 RepID=A0ACC2EQD0_DIPCM|nr:hypothetical protein O6H91_01G040300 [Diphasiastrum complanatum]